MINKTLLAAAATFAMALPAFASEADRSRMQLAAAEHDHEKEHGHGDKAHYEAKSFSSVKEAWAFITEKVTEAEKLLAEKKIEPVHEIGEQLGGAVHTLEEKSDMVAGDKKPKLVSALSQLEKALDDLHHGAEKGDADATALNLKKVKGLLPLVQGLYPAGAL